MIQQVAVVGDSWSYHSWKKGPDFKELPDQLTFQDLFESIDIKCVNYSKKAGSNKDTVDTVKHNSVEINQADLVIIFQTDPLRDVLDHSAQQFKLLDTVPVGLSLEEFSDQLCLQFYNNIKEVVKKPVLLVGGLSSLCFKHIPSTFDYLDKSWTELVDSEVSDCYYEWVDPTLYVYNQLNLPLCEFSNIEKRILAKNHAWQRSDSFSWCHPGQEAYKLMFEVLKDKVKEY